MAGIGDDRQLAARPGLVQLPGTLQRADRVVSAVHDHTRNTLQTCGVFEQLIRAQEGIVHEIVTLDASHAQRHVRLREMRRDSWPLMVNNLLSMGFFKADVILLKAMRGDLDFEESLRQRVALLKGLDCAALEKIRSGLRLSEGAEVLIATLKRLGRRNKLASGILGAVGSTHRGTLILSSVSW